MLVSAWTKLIITEGILRIEPMNFNEISLTPSLPKDGNFLQLKDIKILDQETFCNQKKVFDKTINSNEAISVKLN